MMKKIIEVADEYKYEGFIRWIFIYLIGPIAFVVGLVFEILKVVFHLSKD